MSFDICDMALAVLCGLFVGHFLGYDFAETVREQ